MLLRRLPAPLFLLLLAAAPIAVAQIPVLRQFTYTAQLARDALVLGRVDAAGITWQCSGRTCTTTGPWPAPGVPACAALAARVGVINAYGRAGVALSAAQLVRCNAQARVSTGLNAPITPAQQPAQAGRAGVSVRTAALTLTGTGALAERGAFSPIAVRTNPLALTGTGALAERGAFSPVNVRTQQLTLAGAPPSN